jgi:OOP family OmpA-OmpF porin
VFRKTLRESVMHKNWIVIAIAVSVFSSAGPALAQNEDQQGLYVGGGIGDFSSELDDLDGADIDFDEDESAYKLFVGWRFNQFFAAQFDYLDLGRSDSQIGTGNLAIDTSGYVARVEGTLPLAFFELFATAGLIFSDVNADFAGTEIFDETENDPIYSVGAGVEIAERLTLRLEYEIIDIESFDDAEAVWFTVAWRL